MRASKNKGRKITSNLYGGKSVKAIAMDNARILSDECNRIILLLAKLGTMQSAEQATKYFVHREKSLSRGKEQSANSPLLTQVIATAQTVLHSTRDHSAAYAAALEATGFDLTPAEWQSLLPPPMQYYADYERMGTDTLPICKRAPLTNDERKAERQAVMLFGADGAIMPPDVGNLGIAHHDYAQQIITAMADPQAAMYWASELPHGRLHGYQMYMRRLRHHKATAPDEYKREQRLASALLSAESKRVLKALTQLPLDVCVMTWLEQKAQKAWRNTAITRRAERIYINGTLAFIALPTNNSTAESIAQYAYHALQAADYNRRVQVAMTAQAEYLHALAIDQSPESLA